jgi:transcription elongation factor Elf1
MKLLAYDCLKCGKDNQCSCLIKNKTVSVIYFKQSGKFYCEEEIYISEKLNGYEALTYELPLHHRIKDMDMLVKDSGDGLEPYIVPHLYKAII